ncbi:MAG: hypothetical protein JW904_09660 [Spirochaetales bacterium]|nr:hypothetical protein [Spirochaetales bacterium]
MKKTFVMFPAILICLFLLAGGCTSTATPPPQVKKDVPAELAAGDYMLYIPGEKNPDNVKMDLEANGFQTNKTVSDHFSLATDTASGTKVLKLDTVDDKDETFRIPLAGNEKQITIVFKARGASDPDNFTPFSLFWVLWQRGAYQAKLLHNMYNQIKGSSGMTRLGSLQIANAWHEYRIVFSVGDDNKTMAASLYIDNRLRHETKGYVEAAGDGNYIEFGEADAGMKGFARYAYILVIKEKDVSQSSLAMIGKAVEHDLVTVPGLKDDPVPEGRRPKAKPAGINMTAAEIKSKDPKYVDPSFVKDGKINLSSLPYSKAAAQKVTAKPVLPKNLAEIAAAVVDKSGKDGAFTTIKAAVEKVQPGSIIYIKPGMYQEKLYIFKKDISFIGESPVNTIIYGYEADYGGISSNILVEADPAEGYFTAENITFYNKGAEWNTTWGNEERRSVAFSGKRLPIGYMKNCVFLGQQDTLYLRSGRMYFENCYIEGEVDFICGGATVLFENCHINSLYRSSGGYITASAPSDTMGAGFNNGYVFRNCLFTVDKKNTGQRINLGRGAWTGGSMAKDVPAKTVFMFSVLHDQISRVGWLDWDDESTVARQFYREYKNTGPGAITEERGNRKLMTDEEYQANYSSTEKILGYTPELPY